MQIDIVAAKIALSILDFGTINNIDAPIESEMLSGLEGQLILFNAIFIPHHKRYNRCFTDDSMKIELENLIADYKQIFQGTFIDTDLVLELFKFVSISDISSTAFNECCNRLLDMLEKCNIPEVRYAVLSRLISRIIRCRLYGIQPIDTYLREAIGRVESMLIKYGNLEQISFLE